LKKSLIISCMLVLLAITGILGIGLYVGAQAEKVFLTEEIIIGEKSYAKDVSFQVNSHWDEKMLWEVHTDIGEETITETTFSFYPDGFSNKIEIESEVYFQYPGSFGYGSSAPLLGKDGVSDLPYKKVFEAVAEKTNEGEEYTEIVNLAEYYEYFDLSLKAQSNAYLGHYMSDPETEEEYISKKIALRIPEDLEFEATVKKEIDGEVYDVSGNIVGKDFQVMSGGVVLEDGIYAYIYAKDATGIVPGISETGYGIYRMPMLWGEDDIPILMAESMELFYPLEDEILIMKADESEKILFLLIKRGNELLLQLIERESRKLQQEFELGIAGEHIACRKMEVTDEGVLLIMDDGRFYYAENNGESYEITVNHDMSGYDFYTENRWGTYDYAYKDGRLAFVWSNSDTRDYWYADCNSVYVFVLEGSEMRFLAHYKNSLDQMDANYDYSNKLHPSEPYEVYFQ